MKGIKTQIKAHPTFARFLCGYAFPAGQFSTKDVVYEVHPCTSPLRGSFVN